MKNLQLLWKMLAGVENYGLLGHSSTVTYVILQVNCNKGVTGTIYDYGAKTLNGGEYVPFQQYAGKYILFVNVASFCGLTATYPGKNSSFNSLSELACHTTMLLLEKVLLCCRDWGMNKHTDAIPLNFSILLLLMPELSSFWGPRFSQG